MEEAVRSCAHGGRGGVGCGNAAGAEGDGDAVDVVGDRQDGRAGGSSAAWRCTASAPHHAALRPAWSLSGGSGGLGPARSRRPAAARRRPAPAAGHLVHRAFSFPWGGSWRPLAGRGRRRCPAQRGEKKARIARAKFPGPAACRRQAAGWTGAEGKGSGHMMGRWYPLPSPPTVHPTGRVSGGRWRSLGAPISAAGRRRGPGPGGGRARTTTRRG